MTYQQIIENLANNLTTYFDEVYHGAELITTDEDRYPAVSLGDNWLRLAPTDQQQSLYIRRNGDDEVQSDLKLGSCSRGYNMRSNLRVVYFEADCGNQNKILSNLMQSVLITGTKLKSIIRDKIKLFKDESSGDYNFKPSTVYLAIDIYILWELKPDSCEEDFCVDLDNPMKKCTTVETQS